MDSHESERERVTYNEFYAEGDFSHHSVGPKGVSTPSPPFYRKFLFYSPFLTLNYGHLQGKHDLMYVVCILETTMRAEVICSM